MTYEAHKANALRLQAQAFREEAKAYDCDGNTDMAAHCRRMADHCMDTAADLKTAVPA